MLCQQLGRLVKAIFPLVWVVRNAEHLIFLSFLISGTSGEVARGYSFYPVIVTPTSRLLNSENPTKLRLSSCPLFDSFAFLVSTQWLLARFS